MVSRIPNVLSFIALMAIVVAAVASCAPAASDGDSSGVDVGNTSPPFAMTLEDGTEVSLKNLVDGNQATHLFWFATW